MGKTLPPLTELSAPYFDGARDGKLRLQQCSECKQHQFYPRNICSHCGGDQLAWIDASGRGVIASFTVVRRAISDAYEAPYVIVLIDLEEGPRMMSSLIDADPDSVAIGDPVEVSFADWSEDITMPVFRTV